MPWRCYSGIRWAKNTDNWAWMRLQSCRRPVYFLVMTIIARHSIFSRLSTVGIPTWPWSPCVAGGWGLQWCWWCRSISVSPVGPVIPPGLRDFGISFVPSFSKGVQSIWCGFVLSTTAHVVPIRYPFCLLATRHCNTYTNFIPKTPNSSWHFPKNPIY